MSLFSYSDEGVQYHCETPEGTWKNFIGSNRGNTDATGVLEYSVMAAGVQAEPPRTFGMVLCCLLLGKSAELKVWFSSIFHDLEVQNGSSRHSPRHKSSCKYVQFIEPA